MDGRIVREDRAGCSAEQQAQSRPDGGGSDRGPGAIQHQGAFLQDHAT